MQTHPFSGQMTDQKERLVQTMFSSIAHRYDLNNSLLSLGLHHAWKRRAVALAGVREGMICLDLCSGTGDLAILLARQIQKNHPHSSTDPALDGQSDSQPTRRPVLIIALDLNEQMLNIGKSKIARCGLNPYLTSLRGNAEQLPFGDQCFDLVTVGFGIRNLGHLPRGLAEIHRVLKPHGRLICLEFSQPLSGLIRRLYHFYSFHFLPFIGTAVSGDRTGIYWYLPTSIRQFPDQEGLKRIMLGAGFRKVEYINLTGGIVAIHMGFK